MFPKTSAYVKIYDGQTKCMYFLIEDDDLWENYNTIWDKVLVSNKNLIGSLSIIFFEKENKISRYFKKFIR